MDINYILTAHGVVGGGSFGKALKPPSGVTLSALSYGLNGIASWVAVEGALIGYRYELYINDVLKLEGDTLATSFTIDKSLLTVGAKVYAKVRARWAGESKGSRYSNSAVSTVAKGPQAKPSNPVASGVLLNKASITSAVGSVVSINKTDWFPSPHEFSGLTTGAQYTPYSKFTETVNLNESPLATGTIFTAINKNTQTSPAAPSVSAIKFDRATVAGDNGTEVRIGTGAWFDTPHEFTDLVAETQYTSYARKKETSTQFASPISSGKAFTTPSEVVDDPSGSPGPKNLIAGTIQAGYFGTVPADELWTAAQLATAVGISAGTIVNDMTVWLKFAFKGNILFRPQKAIRNLISWDNINTAGCVFGTKTVAKGALTFKVRLMKGAAKDPTSNPATEDLDSKYSEWNKLMLPIHAQAATKTWAHPQHVEADVPNWGIGFTDADLRTHYSNGNSSFVWCQETRGDKSVERIVRGGQGVSHATSFDSSFETTTLGWAPVLELIQ